MPPRIQYLGYGIDEEGLHPTEEKVRLRMSLNYDPFQVLLITYSRFLPNLSTRLAPLLHKDVKFCLNKEQDKAFNPAKEALQSDSLLIHYDSTKPLTLACDASQ